jgi:hypothetical protein
MTKTYPDHTLENALRARGVPVWALSEIRGPNDTNIAWIVNYAVGKSLVIVHTYKDGDGWDAFTSLHNLNSVEATIDDVMERCGMSKTSKRREAVGR